MDPIFAWIESTSLSIWMRESTSILAFPAILAAHTVGLALVVGINVALDLRVLGIGRAIPVAAMRRFMPVMWGGFAVNAASGLALLAAYPTKALTDPVFYLKLALIAVAIWLLRALQADVFSGGPAQPRLSTRSSVIAVASMACWFGAITAGRLLAYTYTRLTASF